MSKIHAGLGFYYVDLWSFAHSRHCILFNRDFKNCQFFCSSLYYECIKYFSLKITLEMHCYSQCVNTGISNTSHSSNLLNTGLEMPFTCLLTFWWILPLRRSSQIITCLMARSAPRWHYYHEVCYIFKSICTNAIQRWSLMVSFKNNLIRLWTWSFHSEDIRLHNYVLWIENMDFFCLFHLN
jgi:hypothetical protein